MADFVFNRPELESTVEDTVIAWAENHGWISRFMAYRGRRGCRDVDFYGFHQIVMCEFKRPDDGELSANQVKERYRMFKAGLKIHLIDSAAEGIELLRERMRFYDYGDF